MQSTHFLLASTPGMKWKKAHPSRSRAAGLLPSEGSDVWLFLLIQLEGKEEHCSLPTGNPFIL